MTDAPQEKHAEANNAVNTEAPEVSEIESNQEKSVENNATVEESTEADASQESTEEESPQEPIDASEQTMNQDTSSVENDTTPAADAATMADDVTAFSTASTNSPSIPEFHATSPLLQQLLNSLNSSQDSSTVANLLQQIDTKLSSSDTTEQIQFLTAQLESEKQKYEQYTKKVDQWKASVKQISTKDLAKINALKKNVQQLNEQMEELKQQNSALQKGTEKQWDQRFTPRNDHFDILERVRQPNTDTIWTLISYDDKSMGYQWIEDRNISQDKIKLESDLPLTIQERLRKEFDASKQDMTNALEESNKKAEEADNALQQYKSRAHQALKKKAESLSAIKQTHEKEMSELEEQVSELTQTVHDLQQSNKDLNDNLSTLLRVQEEHISLKAMFGEQKRALQELQHSYDLQQIKLKNLERDSEKQNADLENQLKEVIERHSEELLPLQQSNQRLEEDLNRLREKYRQEMSEKDAKITVFQQTCSELKQRIESLQSMQAVTAEALDEGLHAASPSTIQTSSKKKRKHPSSPKQNGHKDEQELKVLRSIVGTDSTMSEQQPAGSPVESVSTAWETDSTHSQSTQRVMQLAEKFAERDAELQDKIQFIKILKESLALKTTEVTQLKETERQLRDQIASIQQLQKKGAPNLEYLKNVFLKYVHTDDEVVRAHSVRALGQLLALPKDEVKRLQEKAKPKSSWF